MKKENAEFLESHYDCLHEVMNAETATKALPIRFELLRIMREEFLPGYAYDDNCGDCLFNMVRLIYRIYEERKQADPLKNVHATFPANNKHHHRK